ncbi:MAG TPA: hypothetical protein VIJ51_07270 [Solirubrobacteraceae bacterium]
MSTDDSSRVVPSRPRRSCPRARTKGLVVQDLGGESLVFDRDRDVAHCLTPDATVVWRACDGEHDHAGLARRTGIDEALVAHALDELSLKGLLDGVPPPAGGGPSVSRRSALRRIGAAGLAASSVPLIFSATIGAPLAHASGGVAAQCEPCTVSGAGDSCGAGLICQNSVCIPQGCNITPCNLGATCGGFFPGTCMTGCAVGQTLCCGSG